MWETLRRSLAALPGADPRFAALAVAFYVLGVWLTARRWRALLRGMGQQVRTSDVALANVSFTFVNNVTPGRVGGEILRVAILRHRSGAELKQAAASAAYDRLVDLAQTPPFLLVALPVLPEFGRRLLGHGSALLLVIGLGVGGLLAYYALPRLRGWLRDQRARFADVIIPRRALAASYFFGSLVWIADAGRILLVAAAFGVWLTPSKAVGLSIAASVGYLVPVMGGVGVVEGSLTGAMCLYGIPLEVALSITMLERLISYALSTTVGGVVVLALGGRRLWQAVRSSSPDAPPASGQLPLAADGTGPACE